MATTIQRTQQLGSTRLMGWLCIIGGCTYLMTGTRNLIMTNTIDNFSAALTLIWACGCICGLLGIRALGVTGDNSVGRTAPMIPLVCFVLIALLSAYGLANPFIIVGSTSVFAQLVSMVGMTFVGVLTYNSRIWNGWRAFSPFFYVVAFLASLIFQAITWVWLGILLIGLAWVAIGYAVTSSTNIENQTAA